MKIIKALTLFLFALCSSVHGEEHKVLLAQIKSSLHSDRPLARELISEAYTKIDSEKDYAALSHLLNLEAHLALLDRELELGLKKVKLAREYATRSNEFSQIANSYREESILVKEMGYLTEALELAEKSLAIVTKYDFKHLLIDNLHSMANLYQNLNNVKKTLETAHRLRNESLNQKKFASVVAADILLASAYRELKNYNEAEKYLNEGLRYAKDNNYPYTGTVYFYFAELERAKGNYKSALNYLNLQWDTDQRYNVILGIAGHFMAKASIYRLQSDVEHYIKTLIETYEHAERYNDLPVKSLASRDLADVYLENKEYLKALEYEKIHIRIEKQRFDQKQAQLLAFNQVRLDLAGKEQQLQEANVKREDAEQFSFIQSFIMAVIGALAFFLAYYLVRYSRQKNDLEKYAVKLNQATEAKSLFLARMSHEIRTPINAIVGLTKLTQSQKTEEDRQENLRQILDSSDTLLGVINDILDFSKIEAGKLNIEKTAFHLDDVLKKTINQNNLRAHEKGLEIIEYIAPDVPNCLIGDPLRIQQILNNLLSNAVKFTSVGTVSVVVSKNFSEDEGLELEFMVRDSGIGLTEQEQQRLFRSFSQADESTTREYGGTGLGLSICKQLVELMGGKIWVNSRKGEGSAFTFTLKLVEDTAASVKEKFEVPDLKDLRVLVADDMVLSRQMICESLESLGIQADQAYDGKNALDMARIAVAKQKPYELLILDWKMPDLDGIEVASVINQSNLYNMPKVLLVSAYDIDQVREQGKPVGIRHYLEKPFNTSELIDTLLHAYRNDTDKTQTYVQESVLPNLEGRKFLLVEDNELNVKVARGFLKETGVSIDVAENGQVALNKLMLSNDFDMVLMDVQMPVMDGITATTKIRNELKLKIPIIAMTAQAMEGDKDRSFSSGMNAYISKPVDSEQLYKTIFDLLDVPALSSVAEENVNYQTTDVVEVTPESVDDDLLILDEARAVAALNGDKELYLGLVSDFVGMKERLLPMKAQVENDQAKDVFQILHSFKSALSYVGAYQLSEFAAAIEKNVYKNETVSSEDARNIDTFLKATHYFINKLS